MCSFSTKHQIKNFEILPIYASYNGSEVGNKDYCESWA